MNGKLNCYEFGCLIDCPCDECIKCDCKYYGDCASCHWFWECPDLLSGCEFAQNDRSSDCANCIITDPDELAQMTDFANWIIEKRKKEQQGN